MIETGNDLISVINGPALLQMYNREVPHIIKYMGSKKSILDFVIGGINEIYTGGKVCDLFAGTSVLSGALGKLVPIHSNASSNFININE